MSRIMHHAIIVTGAIREQMVRAEAMAREVFGWWAPPPLLPALVNGYWTLCIGPDGSKEEWDDSDAGDERRKVFDAWLEAQRYEDGSSPFAWVEVEHGGDERAPARIVHDEARREHWPRATNQERGGGTR